MAHQQDPSADVARVFEAITADETIAHIESRVALLERQLERLESRRDDHGQSLQSSLEVMRARIEDILAAVAGSDEQHRAALADLETRMLEAVKIAEQKIPRSSSHPGPSDDLSDHADLEVFQRRIEDQLQSLRSSQANILLALAASLESRMAQQSEVLSASMATLRSQIEALLGGETHELPASQIEIKLDELANRISATDARWAADRATLAAKLKALETPPK